MDMTEERKSMRATPAGATLDRQPWMMGGRAISAGGPPRTLKARGQAVLLHPA